MEVFVDTSVWSLALRRDRESDEPQVAFLRKLLASGSEVATTGLVLQELLQGMRGPRDRPSIIERFGALRLIVPQPEDHIEAAEVRNTCRRNGVQVGTIDALLAAICTGRDLLMLTTDEDFVHLGRHVPLQVWQPS